MSKFSAVQSSAETLLQLTDLTKMFGDFTANDRISLAIKTGEIHAILGENGAGKSTLMKMIYGVLVPDAGTMIWRGKPVKLRNPAQARALGIGMVFQHFSLFESLSVAENISLAIPQNVRVLRDKIRDVSSQFGLPVDPDALVHALSMGQRQRVEIIRCLLQEPSLIIMDEPTSVLPPSAIPALFETIRKLANSGCSVLFISHKLEEIRSLCHTATVLRAGKIVATVDPTTTSSAALAKLMIGHDIPHPTGSPAKPALEPVLAVENLSIASDDPFGTDLETINLMVRPGEIVGIAGISGNGQSELAAALSGEYPLAHTCKDMIRMNGTGCAHTDCGVRRESGLAFIPEDRNGRGSVPEMTLEQNALLTANTHGLVARGFVKASAVKAFTKNCIETMDVRCNGNLSEARSLSGGNLQKFIVAREMNLRPKVLIASQPTWGVDVGAAAVILQKFVDLRDAGVAILIISDELEYLLDAADRVHVMFRGQMSPSIDRADITDELIGARMAGDFAGGATDAMAGARP